MTQLEILLLLVDRGGAWSPEEVAAELRLTPHSAELRLRELHACGLSSHSPADDTYAYAPATAEQHSSVMALSQCYSTLRHSIITLIFPARGGVAREAPPSSSTRRRR